MWVEKNINSNLNYILAQNRKSEFPKGIERARLAFQENKGNFKLDEGVFYYIDKTFYNCCLSLTATKLIFCFLGEYYKYNITLLFFLQTEIEDISKRILKEYKKIEDELSETKKDKNKMYNLDKERKNATELLNYYKDNHYIDIETCQRAKLKNLPREIPAHSQLTDDEKKAIKPPLIELVSTLPKLKEPFKPKEYYQSLIANF